MLRNVAFRLQRCPPHRSMFDLHVNSPEVFAGIERSKTTKSTIARRMVNGHFDRDRMVLMYSLPLDGYT